MITLGLVANLLMVNLNHYHKTKHMKIFTVLFIFFSSVAFSQTTWYDSNWNKTNKENGVYYRTDNKKVKNGYLVKDYYKNGRIKREGVVTNLNKNDFDGIVTEYFTNGKIAKRYTYKNGVIHGICKDYFTSGELKERCRYRNGKRDGTFKEYYKSGKIKIKGKYRKNQKVGVWKIYYKNE